MRPRAGARALFVATLLTGSFLLFLMQPMAARMALPRLGGTPAVWNSAMLVYQALLLGGYAYAHALGALPPRRQAVVHFIIFLIAAAWLPVKMWEGFPLAALDPLVGVPLLFAASIGPLFFVVAAQAPLMSRWFGLAVPGANPFPLYAASNLGSFAGLLAYPLLLEPALTLRAQSWAWSGGFVLLALLTAACARWLPASDAGGHAPAEAGPAPSWWLRLRWMALAAVPSALILSTSTHLATDMVSMPLLWVVPLGLYLLSFVLAFRERARAADAIEQLLPVVLLLAAGTAFAEGANSTGIAVAGALGTLFATSIGLHRQLYRLRPAPARVTGFYLALSAGGVAGGLFCAIVAPALFDWVYEHPLLIVAAAALATGRPLVSLLGRLWRGPAGPWTGTAIAAAAMALTAYASGRAVTPSTLGSTVAVVGLVSLGVVAIGRPALFALVVAALLLAAGGWRALAVSTQLDARTRSYFGIYTVIDRGDTRDLVSGTTLHGVQRLRSGETRWPTSYYAPGSGVGRALDQAPELFGPDARIGVVGLGTGTLACYRQPGQAWRFYEIDPAVVRIARARFTFLAECAPDAAIVLGDARLSVERGARHDLLVVDAFSSDAVPMHLLTVEAFDSYARALGDRGLLLMHVSNRYLALETVVAGAAAERGWSAALRDDRPDPDATRAGASRSVWIALSRDPAMLERLVTDDGRSVGGWQTLRSRLGFRPWTDDHASILPVLR